MEKFINKIMCRLGKHDLYAVESFSGKTRKVGCRNCQKLWGMNDDTKTFIAWNSDLEDMACLLRKVVE